MRLAAYSDIAQGAVAPAGCLCACARGGASTCGSPAGRHLVMLRGMGTGGPCGAGDRARGETAQHNSVPEVPGGMTGWGGAPVVVDVVCVVASKSKWLPPAHAFNLRPACSYR